MNGGVAQALTVRRLFGILLHGDCHEYTTSVVFPHGCGPGADFANPQDH